MKHLFLSSYFTNIGDLFLEESTEEIIQKYGNSINLLPFNNNEIIVVNGHVVLKKHTQLNRR